MKKKIVFYIATLTRGGAERVIVNLANYFITQDYEVYMLTLEPDEGLYKMDERIKKYVLKAPESGNRIKNALERVFQVRRVLKETGADALVSFIGKTNLRAVLAAFGTHTKVFVSVRSAPAREYGSKMQQMLAKLLFGAADGIVFQTEEAKAFFPKRVQKKSKVLLNPLSPDYIREPFMGERKKEIVTVGRMDEVKNHALLVDAFSLVEKKHPDYHLTIYGDGDCMEAVKKQVNSLGLTEKVRLPGDSRQIPEKIADAGIFVLSSNFEGMPNAVMEAMALGIPVVATDCPSGGAKALVKNEETGLLVPVKNPEKMAEAILRMIEEHGLSQKLSENGYAFSQTVSPDKINKMWKNYIEDVCRQ